MFPVRTEGPCPALPTEQTNIILRHDAVPCGLSRSEIEAIVQDFATRLGLAGIPSSSISVADLVTALGGRLLMRCYLGKDFESVLDVDGDRNFTIWLPDNTAPDRDRFIIGTALGSYVLHYLLPQQNGTLSGPIRVNRWDNGRVGREQAWFAAEFLMPAAVIRQAFAEVLGRRTAEAEDPERQEKRLDAISQELARRFNVPVNIMQARLKGLKLTIPTRRSKKTASEEPNNAVLPTPFDLDLVP